MIYLLTEKASSSQITEMLQEYHNMIKIDVDIRRSMLVGGGEMHADCEQVLLNHGSEQEDIWGANWYPSEQRIEFEALINIRPSQGNRGMVIQSEEIRKAVGNITLDLLGGVQ